MAAEKKEVQVLRSWSTTVMGPEMKPVPRTYVEFLDETGRFGFVHLDVDKPSDDQIREAVLAQRKAAEELKPRRIGL